MPDVEKVGPTVTVEEANLSAWSIHNLVTQYAEDRASYLVAYGPDLDGPEPEAAKPWRVWMEACMAEIERRAMTSEPSHFPSEHGDLR